MQWQALTSLSEWQAVLAASETATQVVFKHSTRCSISSMALSRLERSAQPSNATFHLLDLIKHRDVSNAIAEDLQVYHESPQVIVIKDRTCVYDESHMAIQMDEIITQL